MTLALYSRAAFFPFCIIDDADYVTKNTHVTSGLSVDSIKWALTAFHASNWHPLTWLSLMLDSQLFGLNPMGFHLVNVALHAVNTSLLFLLFRSMTGAVWRSAFVAACFALHPLHVESVAWIAERKDVLSTLFWMLTLLFYSSYVRQAKRSMYVLSLVSFALGLMAKPMLVTIPVILLLLDFWPFERLKIRLSEKSGSSALHQTDNNGGCRLTSLIVEKLPFAALAAASSIVTLYAQKPSMTTLANITLTARVSNALWALLMYIEKMILPFNLAIFYPLADVPLWKAGFAAVVLCGILFMVLKYLKRYPYLATGWFWYLVTLLPVIGLVQVGMQSMADRYTYIPLIGLFTMASWGGAELCRQSPKLKKAISVVAGGALLFFSITTWIQLGYWRDNFTLFNHAAAVTENNYYAHHSLGMLFEQQGKPEQAIAEYQKSIEIEPRNPIVHFDLGFLFDTQGRTSEAIRQYEEVLALDPGYAQAHFSLGIVLGKIGKIKESISEFTEALKIEPDNPKYLNNLGITLAQQGMLDEAIELFSKALQVNPDDEKAYENLQIALQQKSQMPK